MSAGEPLGGQGAGEVRLPAGGLTTPAAFPENALCIARHCNEDERRSHGPQGAHRLVVRGT